jgi:hypothetical protein
MHKCGPNSQVKKKVGLTKTLIEETNRLLYVLTGGMVDAK